MPAVFIFSALKVLIPDTADTESPPVKNAELGLVPIFTPMLVVELLTILPSESNTSTAIADMNALTPVVRGWIAKASLFALPTLISNKLDSLVANDPDEAFKVYPTPDLLILGFVKLAVP